MNINLFCSVIIDNLKLLLIYKKNISKCTHFIAIFLTTNIRKYCIKLTIVSI